MRQTTRLGTGVMIAVLGAVLSSATGLANGERPSLAAACGAWNSHIADLIDQHRIVDEIDEDRFSTIMSQFYDAQSACSALRFAEGLAIYEAISIERVHSTALR